MKAVISADIIGYTKLEAQRAEDVLSGLREFIDDIEGPQIRTNVDVDFKIKRGDAIQGVVFNVSEALRLAIMLKAAVTQISLDKNSKKRHPDIDIRLAIGLGGAENIRTSIDQSSGEAFTNSGRTLDSMKKEKRTFAIKTPIEEWNYELDTAFKLLEVILSSWNITSAELMYWLLKGFNESEIAEKLNISQSAVNQRKKRAGWSGIEALLKRYEQITSKAN